MHRRWRGDCHFRQNPRMSLCESKMLQHRMTGKCAELVPHSQHHGLWIDALKLDLALAQVSLHSGQRSEKIIVPERAPEFTVRHSPKSDVLLSTDYRRDLAILDRPELVGGDFVSFPPGTSFFQRPGAQEAADMVGTEGWSLTSSHSIFRLAVTPDLLRQLDDHPQFRPLFIFRQHIAFFGRREPALRREAKLIERNVSGRFIDPALDIVFRLEPARFRSHEPQHELFLAFAKMAQRFKTASTLGIVFQEISIKVCIAEQMLSYELVTTLRNPCRAKIAAAGMHGDCHVGRLPFERGVGHLRIDRRQLIRIVAAPFGLPALLRIAHHRPGGIIELEIAAAGIIKSANRLAPGRCHISEELVEVGVDLPAHQRPALPEMKRAGSRNAHFRRNAAMSFQELEVLDLRMTDEIYLAADFDAFMLGLDTVKLNAGGSADRFNTLQPAEEIEMPP